MNEINDMSVFNYLRAALLRVLNAAAMGAAYESWGDDFARKEVREAWADTSFKPWGRRLTISELATLSDEQFSTIGFNRWDENLRLIPLWAWNYLRDGETVFSICGDEKVKGEDDIDLDVRFGCIAWGWKTTKTG